MPTICETLKSTPRPVFERWLPFWDRNDPCCLYRFQLLAPFGILLATVGQGILPVSVLLTLPVAVAVMSLCKQVGRFVGINTAVIATLDAETAKTQLMFSMLMVAGLVAGHWLVQLKDEKKRRSVSGKKRNECLFYMCCLRLLDGRRYFKSSPNNSGTWMALVLQHVWLFLSW